MNAHTLDPDQLAADARAALERSVETKVDAVRNLVERSVAADNAEQRAVGVRSDFDAAWATALGTGWTDKELRQLGLAGPGQTSTRAPRRRKSSTVAASPTREQS